MIFMTGATGFLGSHLLEMLLSTGQSIHCLKRSSSDLTRVAHICHLVNWIELKNYEYEDYFNLHKFSGVLHCATNYGRDQNDPTEIVDANLLVPLQILQASVKNHVKYFINTDTILDKRINSYSLSKKHFSDWLAYYKKDIIGVNVALEHFFGPNDNSSKFVTYVLRDLLNGVESIDLTQGRQKRDFIYIEDVVSAFKHIIEDSIGYPNGYYHFEVGTGDSVEIREMTTLLKTLSNNTKTKLNFGAIPYRENEYMNSNVNIDKLKSLGWKQKYSLKEGLAKTIQIERSTIQDQK